MDFAQKMARRTPLELWGILQQPEDYRPEALAAAHTELAARNLSPDETDALARQWATQQAQRAARADHALPLKEKLRLLLLPFWPYGRRALGYHRDGYLRMARETWVWWGYGVILYGCAFALWRLLL